MPEIEVPTEHLHETMEKEAHAAHEGHGGPGWIQGVALSAAFLAVIAAVSALLAGHHANEALLEQIEASDKWAQYQSKSIKGYLLETRQAIEADVGKEAAPEVAAKMKDLEKDKAEISAEAKELAGSSREHLETHVALARTVTLFQVAIAMSAIAVLSRRKWVWLASLALGAVGAALFAMAVVSHAAPHAEEAAKAPAAPAAESGAK